MVRYDIAALKAAQDAHDAEEAPLLEAFDQVVTGFCDTLRAYTTEAAEAGLRGVARLKSRSTQNHRTAFDLMINNVPIILVYGRGAWPFENESQPIARLFGYQEDAVEDVCMFDVCVYQQRVEYQCELRVWVRIEGRSKSVPQTIIAEPATVDGGEQLAVHLINMINDYDSFWRERPTLTSQLDPTNRVSSLGFGRR